MTYLYRIHISIGTAAVLLLRIHVHGTVERRLEEGEEWDLLVTKNLSRLSQSAINTVV